MRILRETRTRARSGSTVTGVASEATHRRSSAQTRKNLSPCLQRSKCRGGTGVTLAVFHDGQTASSAGRSGWVAHRENGAGAQSALGTEPDHRCSGVAAWTGC
jgi:hypothetical protein